MKMLPKDIDLLIKNKSFSKDTMGQSQSQIWIFEDVVLKMEKLEAESTNEAMMMKWLQGKLPVPKIHALCVQDGDQYLLMSRIKGSMACDKEFLNDVEQTLKMLAKALKTIWQVDIKNCPSNQELKEKLRLAEIRLNAGLVDEEDFDRELLNKIGVNTPKEILCYLKTHQPKEELRFSHGDFCLPNIFFNNHQLSGLIDLGQSGVSDIWNDLALCIRSLQYNFGDLFKEEHIEKLMRYLQIPFDEEKYLYYRLLDELF